VLPDDVGVILAVHVEIQPEVEEVIMIDGDQVLVHERAGAGLLGAVGAVEVCTERREKNEVND
jgi:hypothetical protein